MTLMPCPIPRHRFTPLRRQTVSLPIISATIKRAQVHLTELHLLNRPQSGNRSPRAKGR